MTIIHRLISPFALLLVALLSAACSTSSVLETPQPSAYGPVPQLESEKYAAIVVDVNSGRVLHEVNSDVPRFPASLTKMMTVYMTFEAMKAGRITAATEIPVSAYAASKPPTKIGFRPGETIDVDDAIKALVSKSANDVATALGEYLGGSEQRFAEMMTARARSLGMSQTVFRNASGLHDRGQTTTARDMAVLGIALRRDFPMYYSYFSTSEFTYRGRLIRGHNDLLGKVRGVDGIKTGYVRASGFNLVTSVNDDGRRMVAVVMGGPSARSRNDQMEVLVQRFLPLCTRGGSRGSAAPRQAGLAAPVGG